MVGVLGIEPSVGLPDGVTVRSLTLRGHALIFGSCVLFNVAQEHLHEAVDKEFVYTSTANTMISHINSLTNTLPSLTHAQGNLELPTGLEPAYYGFAIRTLTIRGTTTLC